VQIWGFRQKICNKRWKVSVWSERYLTFLTSSEVESPFMILDIFWSRVSIYLLVVWVISKCRKFWNFLLSPQHVSWIGSSRQILRIIWTLRVSPSLCVLVGT
jgi:hypothetical protein